jgi:hypothetical protein
MCMRIPQTPLAFVDRNKPISGTNSMGVDQYDPGMGGAIVRVALGSVQCRIIYERRLQSLLQCIVNDAMLLEAAIPRPQIAHSAEAAQLL